MCANFHIKSFVMLRAKRFALSTSLIIIVLFPTVNREKSLSSLKIEIQSSLHFAIFSCTLLAFDQLANWTTMSCPFHKVSKLVVSSTYFHLGGLFATKSFNHYEE